MEKQRSQGKVRGGVISVLGSFPEGRRISKGYLHVAGSREIQRPGDRLVAFQGKWEAGMWE